jgi:hypothetical protein
MMPIKKANSFSIEAVQYFCAVLFSGFLLGSADQKRMKSHAEEVAALVMRTISADSLLQKLVRP